MIIAHAKYVPVWNGRNAPYHSCEHNFNKKVRKVHEVDQLEALGRFRDSVV